MYLKKHSQREKFPRKKISKNLTVVVFYFLFSLPSTSLYLMLHLIDHTNCHPEVNLLPAS